MNCSISVVVPLYNKCDTIARCIQSVLSDLQEHDELIVIDDGSDDGSGDKAKEFVDSRVSIIKQNNAGVSRARNRGVEAARHPLVAFLDADDYWLPGYRAHVAKGLESFENCVLFGSGHLRVYPGSERSRSYCRDERNGLNNEWESVTGKGFIERYAEKNVVNSSTAIIRKSALMRIGGFPERARCGEDIFVWLRCALEGPVCLSKSELVVVERAEPGASDSRDRVPYFMKWLSEAAVWGELSRDERSALKRFLVRRGANSCAGQVLSGKRSVAWERALVIKKRSPMFIVLGGLIALAPKWVLAKCYRVKQVVKSKGGGGVGVP